MNPDHDVDTEYLYPPERWHRPHAAQPGAMPSVADLVAELALVRGLLRGLVEAVTETSPQVCWFCPGDDPTRHAPTCPWRQAAEYVARNAQGEGK